MTEQRLLSPFSFLFSFLSGFLSSFLFTSCTCTSGRRPKLNWSCGYAESVWSLFRGQARETQPKKVSCRVHSAFAVDVNVNRVGSFPAINKRNDTVVRPGSLNLANKFSEGDRSLLILFD